MKTTEIREKAIRLVERIGRRGTVVICAVILVGVAVLLNLLLFDGSEGRRDDLAVDLDALSADGAVNTGTVTDGENSSAEAVYNYFEAMQLSRRQARDEAMEVLLAVAESSTAVEEMKTDALDDIAQIAADMENESNIETLVISKGFEKCVAVVNGDSASVIVKSAGLLPNEVAQISEIVYEQAGILPANLKIIEKDV
ncbi:MAG: SpoIIIAH-like family protein [Ruminococcaceae bacterium]|nr:SpoIIIAH-like family protein [Oscillospiraceae bacterium]